MGKDFLYNDIANNIAGQIRTGVLKAGDRLPSVRLLCQQHSIGMNTAKRVFLELEAQSLIHSKPQSGYFVSQPAYLKLPLPAASRPSAVAHHQEPNELISRVYANLGRSDLTLFSIGVPSGDLLPKAKLKKEITIAMQGLSAGGIEYESLQGNAKLRRMIAVRSRSWGGNLTEDDLVTTAGGMNALSFCLMALTKPGDTVAIESPCFPGILQLIVGLGLKVLELATHPVTGVDVGALARALPHMNVCLLVPNFNTPLGSCIPDDSKAEIVTLRPDTTFRSSRTTFMATSILARVAPNAAKRSIGKGMCFGAGPFQKHWRQGSGWAGSRPANTRIRS